MKRRVRSAFFAAVLLTALGSLQACSASLPRPQRFADEAIQLDLALPVTAVHFRTNDSSLNDAAALRLAENARWMDDHPNEVLILEGHCDERGSAQSNLALGDRRAREVMAAMIAGGVGEERMAIVSYGETRPADKRHFEGAWRKNRRVEFVIR